MLLSPHTPPQLRMIFKLLFWSSKKHRQKTFGVQSVERQVAHGTSSGSPYISVVYEQKWLKFGLQAHFLKMFGHAKFQLSIPCTHRAMNLLVEIT